MRDNRRTDVVPVPCRTGVVLCIFRTISRSLHALKTHQKITPLLKAMVPLITRDWHGLIKYTNLVLWRGFFKQFLKRKPAFPKINKNKILEYVINVIKESPWIMVLNRTATCLRFSVPAQLREVWFSKME